MSEPFLGEVRMFGFNFPPQGWALCNGQLLPINQNQALFAILGTNYGGNGVTTFALPDLRGRVPVHQGNGVNYGQSAGEENHTLTSSEMPAHIHQVSASTTDASESTPGGNIWGAAPENPYSTGTANTVMNAASMGVAGGSQPHSNMQPYLTLNYCIALVGIFPSRN